MKLVFAILVLNALFTDGKGKSGERHANHENHALNIRKLVKTAVMHQDEALRNSTGTAMPELPESFQFPIVVDLTEFEHMLEQRFNSINGNINSINGNIESLRLKLSGLTGCAIGQKIYYNPTYDSGEKGCDIRTTISFGRTFRWTPNIIVSLNGFNSVGEHTAVYLYAYVTSSTTTQFDLKILGKLVRFYWVQITWVACA